MFARFHSTYSYARTRHLQAHDRSRAMARHLGGRIHFPRMDLQHWTAIRIEPAGTCRARNLQAIKADRARGWDVLLLSGNASSVRRIYRDECGSYESRRPGAARIGHFGIEQGMDYNPRRSQADSGVRLR